jgi:hypothetical protein
MYVDRYPFPINMIDLNDKKVLVRPVVADKDKVKSIVIDNPYAMDEKTHILSREVIAQRTPEGKEALKI